MKKIEVKNGVITEVRIEHEHKSLVVQLDDKNTEVLLLNPKVMIYEDDRFNIMSLQQLEIGRKIAIYVREHTPVAMSLPPQYTPLLLVVSMSEEFVNINWITLMRI